MNELLEAAGRRAGGGERAVISIDSIHADIDLADLVASYLGDGKRSGRELTWLCPFHGERSPSFFVNREKGSFYCFGCGAKGDVIDFVVMIDGVSFEEAIERLGQDARPARKPAGRIRPVPSDPRVDATALWERLPVTDSAGEAYLRGRNLLPSYGIPDVLRYNVGSSGNWWLDEKAAAGYRVAFAVRDPRGNVQTVSLRHVGPGEPPNNKKTLALMGCSTKGAAICQPIVVEPAAGDVEYAHDEVLIVEGGTSWLGAHLETAEAFAEGDDRPIWPLASIGAAMAPGVVTAFAHIIRGRTVLVGLDEDATGEGYVTPTADAAMAAGALRVHRVRRDFCARRAA